jgi:hypothetical protein
MDKRNYGGYVNERQQPRQPLRQYAKIPGVWYIDEVREYLDDASYQSGLAPGVFIPLLNSFGWPRSLFTVTPPTNKSLGCREFVDFSATAAPNFAYPDYGYPFEFYWERRANASAPWSAVTMPAPNIIANRVRIGAESYTTANAVSQPFFGYIGSFRYSSVARYTASADGSTLTIPAGEPNGFGDNILAFLNFNSANTTPITVESNLAPPPTLSVTSGATKVAGTIANPAPPGATHSLELPTSSAASITITAGEDPATSSFSRNPGDFCLEIIFRFRLSDLQFFDFYYSSSDTVLFDLRPFGNYEDEPWQNVDAPTLVINVDSRRLRVMRGDGPAISAAPVIRENTWYHAILNSSSGTWRLYLREMSPNVLPGPQTADLVGKAYTGAHSRILRLRNLTTADNGYQYRARVKYGALRSAYTAHATLGVETVSFSWTGPYFNNNTGLLNLLGPNAVEQGAEVIIQATAVGSGGITSNQLQYRWQVATNKTIAEGGALIVTADVENWLSAAPTSPTPEDALNWTTLQGSNYDQNNISFNPIFSGNGEYIAVRAFATCGANTDYSPVRFIQRLP